MALSWRNLPCALKAAIVIGKRTLGALASLPRAGGRSKGLDLLRGASARPERGVPDSLDEAKAAVAARWPLPVGPVRGRLASWGSSRPRPLYKRSHVALKAVPPDLRAVPAVWARLAARD